jgi:hypothetical protein
MKKIGRLVLDSITLLTIANLNFVNAQAQKAPQPAVQVGEDNRFNNLPQDFVVCTGWHALCSASINLPKALPASTAGAEALASRRWPSSVNLRPMPAWCPYSASF